MKINRAVGYIQIFLAFLIGIITIGLYFEGDIIEVYGVTSVLTMITIVILITIILQAILNIMGEK